MHFDNSGTETKRKESAGKGIEEREKKLDKEKKAHEKEQQKEERKR